MATDGWLLSVPRHVLRDEISGMGLDQTAGSASIPLVIAFCKYILYLLPRSIGEEDSLAITGVLARLY